MPTVLVADVATDVAAGAVSDADVQNTRVMRPATYHLARLALLLFGCASIVLSLKLSAYRFGSSDYSEMIDVGWRIVSGQMPGRDFVCTFPPFFYLFVAGIFRQFGVNWHVLAVGEAVFFALFCLLGLRLADMLRPVLGASRAFLLFFSFFVAQLVPLVSINMPWHASFAQSIGCYAVLVTLVLLHLDRTSAWRRLELWSHLTLAFAGLVLSKPNTAYPVLILCLFLFWRSGLSRWYVLGSGLAALVLASAVLSTVHVSLLGMLHGYSGLTGRLMPRPLTYGILLTHPDAVAVIGLSNLCVYAIIAPVLSLLCVLSWRGRHRLVHRLSVLLAWGAVLTGVLGMATNFDLKLTDTPLVLLGLAIFIVAEPALTGQLRSRLLGTTLALVYFAFLVGVMRLRGQTIGLWANDECGPRVLLHDSFFGTFHNCSALGSVMQEADRTLASGPAHRRIFFGPGLEFLYARNRIQSPLHLPLWWHPGTSYPIRDTDKIDRAWDADRFDTVIFIHDKTGNTPQPVLDAVHTRYTQVPGTTYIDVFNLRPSTGQEMGQIK